MVRSLLLLLQTELTLRPRFSSLRPFVGLLGQISVSFTALGIPKITHTGCPPGCLLKVLTGVVREWQ